MSSDGSLSEKITLYSDARIATMRRGGLLVATCAVFWAIARSPDFQFEGLLGIKGEIHNGYIAACGHFILLALAAIYSWRLSECLGLRRAVLDDVGTSPVSQSSGCHTERFLMRLPYEPDLPIILGRWPRLKRAVEMAKPLTTLAPVLPLLVAVVVYIVFMVGYFEFYRPDHRAERFADLLFGYGKNGMFQAKWDLRMGKNIDTTICINAPWQTWIGLIGGVYLVYRLVLGVLRTWRADR
jgi:hypothetical protein